MSKELGKLRDGLDRAIKPLYLLHGDERLLIDEGASLIEAVALHSSPADFNRTVTNAKEMKISAVVGLANTLPMLGDRRFIVLKDIHYYNSAEMKLLVPYLERPNPKTTLLMTAAKIDARLKAIKLIKKNGTVIKFSRPYDNKVPGWIIDNVGSVGCTIDREAAGLLADIVGNDLMALRRTLEQLSLYLGGSGDITSNVVESLVARVKVNSVFDLCDAIGERNRDKALGIMRNMLRNRIAPLQMLAMIVRHFRQLWTAKSLSARRVPAKEIAGALGMHPFFVKGILQQQHKYSNQDLQKAFHLLLEADFLLKSSPLKPAVLIETMVLKLMR